VRTSARAASIDLTATKAAVLGAAPAEDLRRVIEEVAKTQERRRALVRLALGTAAVGTVAFGAALGFGCDVRTAGARHDLPPGRFVGWLVTADLVGPRSSDEILEILRTSAPEFASSDWVVGSASPPPVGFLEYRVKVSSGGGVRHVKRVGDQPADSGVLRFLSSTLNHLQWFDPSVGESEFTVRFVFEPR
jgi:hypothetical protein